MGEFISREAALKDFEANNARNPYWTPQRVKTLLLRQPAADVAEVVHGRWDDSGRYTFADGSTAVRCTKCGCSLSVREYCANNWYYCPVCGAWMDDATERSTNEQTNECG